ncbi:hypothetical protein HY218_00330 [Candidatus Saccharibacteria bacterium]|nr:hypothetical protein [Candidatus Saccharibacteria bacterium]
MPVHMPDFMYAAATNQLTAPAGLDVMQATPVTTTQPPEQAHYHPDLLYRDKPEVIATGLFILAVMALAIKYRDRFIRQ